MVAIDRLREVATRVEDGGCVSPGGECRREGGITCRSCLADELYGIACQAEAERERESAALFDARVGEEIDLCELFGIEPGDDPLTAIRCHVEGQDDTIENLRLDLGKWGAFAAWVRDHGGLEKVKRQRLESVPRDAYERHLARRQRQIDESHAALRRRNKLLEQYRTANETLLERCAKMKRRLMPEGMEWPRWDGGTPVTLAEGHGDDVVHTVAFHYQTSVIDHKSPYVEVNPTLMPNSKTKLLDMGERLPRPAPKVLDADGVEIREGDTLWHVETGEQCKVVGVDSRSVSVDFRVDGDGTKHTGSILPSNLTHRAPVPAADGKPLEVGQAVWDVESGTEYEVVGIHADEDSPVRVMRTDGSHLAKAAKSSTLTHERPVLDADGVPIHEGDTLYEVGENYPPFIVDRLPKPGAYRSVKVTYPSGAFTFLDPERLTHTEPEPPDSWERLEEDAANLDEMPCDYSAKDLVRRAKALAGRDA